VQQQPNQHNRLCCIPYFWETATNIASFTATPALQRGHSTNAVEDNASVAPLTNAVSNFGTAYATTQESLRNNNASINAMQGLIQMLCNAIGNQPPSSMLRYPQQNNQDHRARSSCRGQQQNQGQLRQPIGSGCGSNNGGKGNGLYKGNSGGYYQGGGMNFNGSGGNYPTPGTSHRKILKVFPFGTMYPFGTITNLTPTLFFTLLK
jgi:hypothetical protein